MGGNAVSQIISQSLYLVPLLLVGIFGIVVFFTLPVPARVRAFGTGGLALLLVNALGGAVFFAWYAQAMAEGGGSQLAAAMGVMRLLTSVLHATAIALLVAAAFAGRGIKAP
jgi:hypothetical protein